METKVQTKQAEAPIKIAVVVTYLIMIVSQCHGKHPADQRHRHGCGIGFLSELVCTCRIDVFDLGRHLSVVGGLYALPIRHYSKGIRAR